MEVAREERRLMDLLGFDTREQLIEFLNSPDSPTGNMVPPGQSERDIRILVEGKEEIHNLSKSLGGEIQREIDIEIADKLLKEERGKDHRQMAGSFKAGQAVRALSLDEVYLASEGLTQQTSELGFGKVAAPEDVFKIEQKILNSSPQHRTSGENQFLARMRVVRAAALDQVLLELAEEVAAEFRAEANTAREDSAEHVAQVPSQAENLRIAATEFRPEDHYTEANAAQQSGAANHSKAAGLVAGSESAAETFKIMKDEDPFEELARAAWDGIQERIRNLPAPKARVITANEGIIKMEAAEAGRMAMGVGDAERPATQREASEKSDNALIAKYKRSHNGIRAIWRFFWETTTGMLGLALGWKVRRHDASPSQPLPDTNQISVRRAWPLLTGAGIATAWFFSPFNAFPALLLLALSIQFGFNHLKKRSSPIFLKSALLFLILFVPTGMIHDAFFDHPTARCSDGWYSYSASRSGTCSGHNGVSRWQPKRKHWWQAGSGYASSGTPSQGHRRRRIPSVLQ
jgi:hypothetical protein